MKFSRCLSTYFLCLLRMPDQSIMNETNLQYHHKNHLPLIFLKVYYGRLYQTPFEDLSVSSSKETTIKALQNFVIQL